MAKIISGQMYYLTGDIAPQLGITTRTVTRWFTQGHATHYSPEGKKKVELSVYQDPATGRHMITEQDAKSLIDLLKPQSTNK